ncbi:MAG: hypothetical protein IKJ26_05425 [Clostridia bacterium]|nr:hypothetical protein [Clostridia bacterium]
MPQKHNPQPQPPVEQRPVGEEETEVRKPSALRRILTRVGMAVLLVIALVLCYVFLLLGEPAQDELSSAIVEDTIQMPMSPLESPGETNVQGLADTFGQPVLSLQSGLSMMKARIYDTAFEGGYARRVTLTYALPDGTQLTAESIRPTSAVTLLSLPGAKLDATSLYTLGGLNAARMDNQSTICIFGQSDTAVYAVIGPAAQEKQLLDALQQSMLTEPSAND